MTENRSQNNGIEWGSLILGVIFIIAALFAFRNPGASLISIVLVAGISAIMRGIFLIMSRNRIKERTGKGVNVLIVVGVIDIIIGVIILANIVTAIAVLPWVLAFWFIFDGISDIIFSFTYDIFGSGYKILNIISSIIGIILGVMIIRNPLGGYFAAVFIVGFYFMLAGIRYIIQGIF